MHPLRQREEQPQQAGCCGGHIQLPVITLDYFQPAVDARRRDPSIRTGGLIALDEKANLIAFSPAADNAVDEQLPGIRLAKHNVSRFDLFWLAWCDKQCITITHEGVHTRSACREAHRFAAAQQLGANGGEIIRGDG